MSIPHEISVMVLCYCWYLQTCRDIRESTGGGQCDSEELDQVGRQPSHCSVQTARGTH